MAALLLNEPPELAERKDPVLVAQSPQAAISLLRQLAPKNTLPMEMWQRLIDVFGQNEGVNGCGLEKPEEEGVSAEADLGHGTGVAMDDSYQTLNDGDDCRRQLNNYHPFEPCLGPRFTDAQNTDHIESTSKRRAGTEKSIAPKRKSRSTKKELQMIRLLKARCQAQGEQLARTFKRKEHPSGPSGVGRKAKRTKPSPCVPACDKSFDTEFDDAERPFAKAIMQTEGSRRKQRKLNTAKVKDIIVKVQALANDDVLRQCRDIVSYWRRSGSLVSAPALPANENGERRKRSEAVTAIKELRQWYHVVYDMSENSTVADLTYRIWHAELGREYEKLRVRYSSTHASKRLFWQLHPELIAGHDMSHVAPSIRYPDPWKSFEKRLRKSRRWYQIACKLGWSIFFLFARNAIPHSWVEECAKDELDAWTVAIQTCRPEIWLDSTRRESAQNVIH
ncbi:uncharacterized protein K452DRAFT_317373 [Aplosporella prunicola CBS 121167]|uniref:Uncharacterized protein n=1 Tax=Aplosporella prunicola CBS 121167 TaxID=1176127 RepID=A0A6A6BIQ6_9PEZI|nr:uncharacterized protein K452DRAFT_317373 [Aplosporella prunicola CBS 121167]KAF2143154.1 hypothetical protein K452DRAFT_317373 [Aplosporella prunicola CBS 121167]